MQKTKMCIRTNENPFGDERVFSPTAFKVYNGRSIFVNIPEENEEFICVIEDINETKITFKNADIGFGRIRKEMRVTVYPHDIITGKIKIRIDGCNTYLKPTDLISNPGFTKTETVFNKARIKPGRYMVKESDNNIEKEIRVIRVDAYSIEIHPSWVSDVLPNWVMSTNKFTDMFEYFEQI